MKERTKIGLRILAFLPYYFTQLKNKIQQHITEVVKKNVENSYWDVLVDDLLSVPIDVMLLKSILNEIKYVIYNLIPKRIDMLVDLELSVNIDNIKSDDVDTHYIISCIDYYFNLAMKLESEEYDEETEEYHKLLKQGMINGYDLELFVPICLRYLINLYYKTWDEMNFVMEEYEEWKKKKRDVTDI